MSALDIAILLLGAFAVGWIAGHNVAWKKSADDVAFLAKLREECALLDRMASCIGEGEYRAIGRGTLLFGRREYDLRITRSPDTPLIDAAISKLSQKE